MKGRTKGKSCSFLVQKCVYFGVEVVAPQTSPNIAATTFSSERESAFVCLCVRAGVFIDSMPVIYSQYINTECYLSLFVKFNRYSRDKVRAVKSIIALYIATLSHT